jgi:predicted Fe-S protein YdhL (DUF1289 family)
MTATLTPCIKLCTLDPQSGLCLGCGRNVDEIATWSGLADRERARIMGLLPARLSRLRETRAQAGAGS